MDIGEIIKNLEEHNRWLSGLDGEQVNQKNIGKAICKAITLLKKQCHGKMELPDEAKAVRHRVQLHGESMYISVVLVDGIPVEVFANAPTEWRHNIERMSFLESLNRQVSISLRYGAPVDEVVKQLTKGSATGQFQILLAEILRGYVL